MSQEERRTAPEQPTKPPAYRVWYREEGWRAGYLVREIKRGDDAGKFVFAMPKASGGMKQRTVRPEDVICTCCGLDLGGTKLVKVPGGVVIPRRLTAEDIQERKKAARKRARKKKAKVRKKRKSS